MTVEIDEDRLDELEGADELVEWLRIEIEDMMDSLDEHVTPGNVHEQLRYLITMIYDGGPER